MQLMLNRPSAQQLFIRSCKPDAIVVVNQELRKSFILSTERLIENWPVRSINDLNDALLAPILDQNPDVVLLGTGSKPIFPTQATFGKFLSRHIGCEVMDNAAASRTFNVLAGEGRNVAAAFILQM